MGIYVPAVLFWLSFSILGLDWIITKIKLDVNPYKIFISIISLILFCIGTAKANSILPVIPYNAKIIESITTLDLNTELSIIFEKYNIVDFESLQNQATIACTLEERFKYILTSINKIEETQSNCVTRYKQLKKRQKNLINNLAKINKRSANANIDSLYMNIPEIRTTKVNLKNPYKRIIIYANGIHKNLTESKCSKECSFRHIDTYSINIVKEIDSIHKEQNLVNKQLSDLEKIFDKLEEIQTQAELKLAKLGY